MPTTTKSTFTNIMSKAKLPSARTSPNPSSLAGAEQPNCPPTPICEDINSRIRLNPQHAYPHFDFASYARHRSYTLCTIDFGTTTSACFLDDGVHDLVAGLISRMPPTQSIPSTSPFEIRHAGEKGLGMFATAPIHPTTPILTEHPTIITPYLLGIPLPLSEMYTELFESLPKSILTLTTSLATSSKDDDMAFIKPSPSPHNTSLLPPVSFYEDIMQTNALAIDLHVPLDIPHRELKTHRALFLLTSRCNHSCNPNASWTWDPSTLTLTLTPLRPIAPGEEISISYIPLFESHPHRQEMLKKLYGFECSCETCILPPYEPTEGDVASEISTDTDGSTLPTFEEWCRDSTLPDNILINAHKRALHVIEQQGLKDLKSTLRITVNGEVDEGHDGDGDDGDPDPESYWQMQLMHSSIGPLNTTTQAIDHHVDVIAMCYGALGDVTNFRNWIAIVKDARVESGAHPEQRIVFNKWLSNPESFPLWKWREKTQSAGRKAKGKVKWIMWK